MMIIFLFSIISFFLFNQQHNVSADVYTIEQMKEDSEKNINFQELIPFRGPILKDHWITNSKETHHQEHQLCRDLYIKALATVNVTRFVPHFDNLPAEFKKAYLLDGKIELGGNSPNQQVYNGGAGYSWTKEVFHKYQQQANICGGYGDPSCDHMMKKYASTLIKGKVTMVLGSETPWAESALFNNGAAKVITIEYMKIASDMPHFASFHPSEVAENYLKKEWELVDFAFSYSSIEHDGLGRYGDPITPFADFESTARIRCLLKPGGVLFLAVPVGYDTLVWNAHRIYGRYRLALLRLGWNILDFYPLNGIVDGSKKGGYYTQPIMVLQKPHHED